MRTDLRLKLLVVAHVVIALAVVSYRPNVLPLAPFGLVFLPVVALIPAQACLLGAWVGLSAAPSAKRLTALLLGLAYLVAAFSLATPRMNKIVCLMPPVIAVGVATILINLRHRSLRLERFAGAAPVSASRALRSSIRELMVFTVAVALSAALFRSIRGMFDQGPELIPVMFWSVCFVVVCLATVWTALGTDCPGFKTLVVMPLTVVVGALMPVATNPTDWRSYFSYIACQMLQALIALGSLLVVRACGYRLVRAAPMSGADAAPERVASLSGCAPVRADSYPWLSPPVEESGPK